jgi:hypothetical protein
MRVRRSRLYHNRKDKQRCLQCSQALLRVAVIVHRFQTRRLYMETECQHDGSPTYSEVVCQWSTQNIPHGSSILPQVASRHRRASGVLCCVMEALRFHSIYSTIFRLLLTIHCQYVQADPSTSHCDAVSDYLKLLAWIRCAPPGVNIVRGPSVRTWERSLFAPSRECVVACPSGE